MVRSLISNFGFFAIVFATGPVGLAACSAPPGEGSSSSAGGSTYVQASTGGSVATGGAGASGGGGATGGSDSDGRRPPASAGPSVSSTFNPLAAA